MKRICTFILIVMLLVSILPVSVLAADDDSNGYDDNDFAKLQAFLDLPSAVADKTNGQCINASYNRTNPASWTGVAWNSQTPKRVTTIGLSYTWWNKSLAGALDLESFTSLTILECGANQITALNLDGDTALTSVQCFTNKLVSLDISTNTALTYLLCSNNLLESLTLAGADSLATLKLDGNRLSALDVSGVPAITELSCGNNPITTLDISHNAAMETLKCNSTNINTLDLSANDNLEVLQCFYSPALVSVNLDGADALTELSASNCALASVDVRHNPNLTGLYIYNNQIDSLDVTHNPELKYLYCENNLLAALDLSQNSKLVYLYCDHNQISSLDISTCTVLNNLRCNSNLLTTLDASASTDMFSLGCADNPLTRIDAVINGHPITVTANGSGYVDASYNCWGPYTYHVRAYPQEGTKLDSWTSSGAVVSSAADYALSTAGSYNLTANFTYTVTFDRNEGDIDADPIALEVVSNNTITAMPKPPERGGYQFDGWYQEAACVNAWSLASDTVTEDITLYVKWTRVHTIVFDSVGGSTVDAQTVRQDGRVTEPPVPTQSGYVFGGWYTDEGLTDAWDFDADTVTEDITLHAKWTELLFGTTEPDATIYTGGRITLTPSVEGGVWDWDEGYFTATFNSPATFTALKEGKSTITYTVDGVSVNYTVTIKKSNLPPTGQDFTWVLAFGLASIIFLVSTRFLSKHRQLSDHNK